MRGVASGGGDGKLRCSEGTTDVAGWRAVFDHGRVGTDFGLDENRPDLHGEVSLGFWKDLGGWEIDVGPVVSEHFAHYCVVFFFCDPHPALKSLTGQAVAFENDESIKPGQFAPTAFASNIVEVRVAHGTRDQSNLVADFGVGNDALFGGA